MTSRSSTSHASISLATARACNLIEQWTGITLSGAAPHRLHDFLQRRAHALSFDSALDYLRHIEHATRDHPEVTLLINLITNGLTTFWRDPPQLDAARLAMQQLASPHRTISIWCAGCSTGEEAYTLAMLAQENNIRANILGTDLNTDRLLHARQATFHPWSMRRLDPARISRFFSPLPDGRFTIHTNLSQHVSFLRHNLLDPPPSPPHAPAWDMIVCRNVLIYLKDIHLRAVIDHFATALTLDGYLMLGSSEQLNAHYDDHNSPFRAAQHGAGFVYRLRAKTSGSTVYKLPLLRDTTPPPPILSRSTIDSLSELSEETVEVDTDTVLPELLQQGIHALSTDIDLAIAHFEAAISYDPFATDAHHAIAHTLQPYAPQQAADSWRKVLFIDPLHWLAAIELAHLLERSGDIARARALYRQALEGLTHRTSPLFDTLAAKRHLEPNDAQRLLARNVALTRYTALSNPK